jgi:hypothetical protein
VGIRESWNFLEDSYPLSLLSARGTIKVYQYRSNLSSRFRSTWICIYSSLVKFRSSLLILEIFSDESALVLRVCDFDYLRVGICLWSSSFCSLVLFVYIFERISVSIMLSYSLVLTLSIDKRLLYSAKGLKVCSKTNCLFFPGILSISYSLF